jgi:hypothetical protein
LLQNKGKTVLQFLKSSTVQEFYWESNHSFWVCGRIQICKQTHILI